MTDQENKGKPVLQMTVLRETNPPYEFFISTDLKPENKREWLEALQFMAERCMFAAEYLQRQIVVAEQQNLANNIDTEELR